MRILVASKFWYRRGGLERVMMDEVAWLRDAGHEVACFAAAHPCNDASPWSPYFAPYVELGEGSSAGLGDKVRAAARMFWNAPAASAMARLLDDFRPDVVHIHGIHRQLSPSVLGAAARRGIPVVQTLHDYHHVCPNDVLLHAGCEPCSPRRCGTLDYSSAVRARCVRGSLSASALSAAETSWQRLSRSYERGVRRFIAPSAFMAEQMRDAGWDVPVDVIPNAVPLPPAEPTSGEYFLFAGRLAEEKGVDVALEAARRAGVELVVAGEGPLGAELRERYPDAAMLGRVDGDRVAELMRDARAVVVPSRWYENAPMSVLEAMAGSVPVVASRIGGIPEQVTDGAEGVLVPPGDVDALAAALAALSHDVPLARRLGSAGRDRVARDFSPPRHMDRLMESYHAARAA